MNSTKKRPPPAPRHVTWQCAKAVARGFLSGRAISELAINFGLDVSEVEACIRRWTVTR